MCLSYCLMWLAIIEAINLDTWQGPEQSKGSHGKHKLLPPPDLVKLSFDVVRNDQASHNHNVHRHITDIKIFCEQKDLVTAHTGLPFDVVK